MTETLVVVALLAGAGLVWLLGKKYVNPQAAQSAYRMQDAWDHIMSSAQSLPSEQLSTLGQSIQRLPEEAIERVRQRLLHLEQQVLEAPDPVRALRAATMDAASNSLYAAHILLLNEQDRERLVDKFGSSYGDVEMLTSLVAQELEYTVLRVFAQYRFDDADDKDWFSAYMNVARRLMQARSAPSGKKGALREDTISGMYQVEYLMLLERLKERLLNAPRKTKLDEAGIADELSSSGG